MVQAGKERMRKLVLKYGEKPDEDDMNEADWFEYQAVKKYEDEVTGEMIKDKIKNGIVSSIFPVGLASYKTAKAFGEFVADTQIAYKYKRAMDETGGKLVRKYGSGQGAEIDNYYQSWQDLPNAFVSEGEFIDLFFSSDAMILDSISFIAEYFITGKPMCIQTPKHNFKFNSFTEKLKDNLYKSNCYDDVINFVDNIVCSKQDSSLSNNRQQIIYNQFLPPNNKSAAFNIYDYICNEIFKGKI